MPIKRLLLPGWIGILKGETWIPGIPRERAVLDRDQPQARSAFEASYPFATCLRS